MLKRDAQELPVMDATKRRFLALLVSGFVFAAGISRMSL